MSGEEHLILCDGKLNDLLAWHISELESALQSCKTEKDILELIARVVKLPEITHEFKTMNLQKALKCKDEGNALFKSRQFEKARNLYTEALSLYPLNSEDPSSNVDYAVIAANRSACLDALRAYEGVILDVALALKYGYPKELQWKIWNRKGVACLKLKQYSKSKDAFHQCLLFIGKSNLSTKERDSLRLKVQKHINVFGLLKGDASERERKENCKEEIPELIKVNIKDGEVVSQIEFGDKVLVERPLAVFLSNCRADGQICSQCLKRMPAPVPCSLGSSTFFYDETSRDEANFSYHQIECHLLEDFVVNGLGPIARLAFRLIICNQKETNKDLLSLYSSIDDLCPREKLSIGILALYFEKAFSSLDFVSCAVFNFIILAIALRHYTSIFSLIPHPDPQTLLQSSHFPTNTIAIGLYVNYAHLKNRVSSTDFVLFFERHEPKILNLSSLFPSILPGTILPLNSVFDETETKKILVLKCDATLDCKGVFRICEKTQEFQFLCSLCGLENNIWSRLKRYVEFQGKREKALELVKGRKTKEAINSLVQIRKDSESLLEPSSSFLRRLAKDIQILYLIETSEKESP